MHLFIRFCNVSQLEILHVYLYFSVESFIFVSKNQWKKQQQGTMENYQV